MIEKEIPERQVDHGMEEYEDLPGHLVGEANALPMNPTAKKKARLRREYLDSLGGFGFGKRDA